MSGTKKTYHLDSKNYFEFFNIEEKFAISLRSLTTHYKKVTTILSEKIQHETNILARDRLLFAQRAFETLHHPLERARYIIGLHDVDNDLRDSILMEDASLCSELEYELSQAVTEEDIELFQENIKEQSDFILENIEKNIDDYKNYEAAASLVSAWYDLRELYEQSKEKKIKLQDGIVFVAF